MELCSKCYRCEQEVEKLYMVPYVTKEFIDVTICRECSIEFHKQIKKFTNDFIFKKNSNNIEPKIALGRHDFPISNVSTLYKVIEY